MNQKKSNKNVTSDFHEKNVKVVNKMYTSSYVLKPKSRKIKTMINIKWIGMFYMGQMVEKWYIN